MLNDREPALTVGTELLPQATAVARTLPHDIPTFTGRHRELNRLVEAVTSGNDAVHIVAIDGMAGVGKTTLAVRTAHLMTDRFPDGQLFLDLHAHTAGQSPVSPTDALHTLLCSTGVEPAAVPPKLDDRAALWRSRLAGRRILVLLDNAVGHEQVRPLLPGVSGCCVMITGRRRLTALDGAVMMPLDILPPDDAAELFVRIAGTGDPHDTAVRRLTAQVGYLPLAIRLLGGWLRGHPSWSVNHLVTELETAKDRSAAIRAENVIVGAAFDMSFDALRARQKAFFVELGHHPGVDFDAATAAALTDVDEHEARQTLDELYNDHLVEEPVRGRYQFHDLIRDYARGLAVQRPEQASAQAMTRLLDHYSTMARATSRLLRGKEPVAGSLSTFADATAWLDAELPNLLATIEHTTAQQPSSVAWLSHLLNPYFARHGHWQQAIALYETVRPTVDDPAIKAAVLRDLGLLYRLSGDFDVAESCLRAALDLHEELGDQRGMGDALGQLGAIYRWTGSLHTSLGYANRALEIFRAVHDVGGAASLLTEIGELQSRLGDHATARATALAAVQACREVGSRAREARTLGTLGLIELRQGLYDQAEATLRNALTIAREMNLRIAQGDALRNLGVVYRTVGRHDDAHIVLTQALETYTDIGERRGQTTTLIDIGRLVCDRDPASAQRIHVATLRAARAISNPVLEARSWQGIGRSFVVRGEVAAGLVRLRRALDIFRAIGDHDGKVLEDLILELESEGHGGASR